MKRVTTLLNFWFISLFFLVLPLVSAAYGMPDNGSEAKLDYVKQPETANTNQYHNQLLDFIYGRDPKNGLIYLPFGKHTQISDKELSANNLIGVVYNSVSFGSFINSYHDRTWYLVVMRNIFSFRGFGLDYFAGLLYGYNGKLANIEGIPFRDTFLFKSDINPIISVNTYYEVADFLHVEALISPLVILYGVKYNI